MFLVLQPFIVLTAEGELAQSLSRKLKETVDVEEKQRDRDRQREMLDEKVRKGEMTPFEAAGMSAFEKGFRRQGDNVRDRPPPTVDSASQKASELKAKAKTTKSGHDFKRKMDIEDDDDETTTTSTTVKKASKHKGKTKRNSKSKPQPDKQKIKQTPDQPQVGASSTPSSSSTVALSSSSSTILVCDRCGQSLATSAAKAEHDDWHVAMDLSKNERGLARPARKRVRSSKASDSMQTQHASDNLSDLSPEERAFVFGNSASTNASVSEPQTTQLQDSSTSVESTTATAKKKRKLSKFSEQDGKANGKQSKVEADESRMDDGDSDEDAMLEDDSDYGEEQTDDLTLSSMSDGEDAGKKKKKKSPQKKGKAKSKTSKPRKRRSEVLIRLVYVLNS